MLTHPPRILKLGIGIPRLWSLPSVYNAKRTYSSGLERPAAVPQEVSTVERDLTAVRHAVSKNLKQPFCAGTYPLIGNSGRLFFLDHGGSVHCLDLANADETELQNLVGACGGAAFGVNNKNVLDETYRKAWKMDSSNFATRLAVTTEIMDRVCDKLMRGDTERKIRPEMYKLNVYGPGSFFKTHRDTPRSRKIFGSLVVVFPTRHKGGALQLRHKGEEWTFDSAALTSSQKVPSVAYIAFYSDVEHEVSMVTSGFRVTMTYNLYFDDTMPNPSHSWMKEDEIALHSSLSALLQNPDVLPEGGYLAFGLDFMYPVLPKGVSLKTLIKYLKGSDEILKRVLKRLSLKPQVKVIYESEDKGDLYDGQGHRRKAPKIMLDDVNLFPDLQVEEGLVAELTAKEAGGKLIGGADEKDVFKDTSGKRIRPNDVLWITPLTPFSRVRTPYVAYGNEASLGYCYGNLCLVVKVSSSRRRMKSIGT